MAEIIWSPAATSDLEQICEFIATESEYYACVFAQKVVALIETIPTFPRAGRIVPEYQKENLRERILHNYRVVYRLLPETIEIVAIVHSARILPDLTE
jgi:toxin ParE1/3/4